MCSFSFDVQLDLTSDGFRRIVETLAKPKTQRALPINRQEYWEISPPDLTSIPLYATCEAACFALLADDKTQDPVLLL